jgi:hypothetical protein
VKILPGLVGHHAWVTGRLHRQPDFQLGMPDAGQNAQISGLVSQLWRRRGSKVRVAAESDDADAQSPWGTCPIFLGFC